MVISDDEQGGITPQRLDPVDNAKRFKDWLCNTYDQLYESQNGEGWKLVVSRKHAKEYQVWEHNIQKLDDFTKYARLRLVGEVSEENIAKAKKALTVLLEQPYPYLPERFELVQAAVDNGEDPFGDNELFGLSSWCRTLSAAPVASTRPRKNNVSAPYIYANDERTGEYKEIDKAKLFDRELDYATLKEFLDGERKKRQQDDDRLPGEEVFMEFEDPEELIWTKQFYAAINSHKDEAHRLVPVRTVHGGNA